MSEEYINERIYNWLVCQLHLKTGYCFLYCIWIIYCCTITILKPGGLNHFYLLTSLWVSYLVGCKMGGSSPGVAWDHWCAWHHQVVQLVLKYPKQLHSHVLRMVLPMSRASLSIPSLSFLGKLSWAFAQCGLKKARKWEQKL